MEDDQKTDNRKHHQTQHDTTNVAITLHNDSPQHCNHHDIQMYDPLKQIVLEMKHNNNNKMGTTQDIIPMQEDRIIYEQVEAQEVKQWPENNILKAE